MSDLTTSNYLLTDLDKNTPLNLKLIPLSNIPSFDELDNSEILRDIGDVLNVESHSKEKNPNFTTSFLFSFKNVLTDCLTLSDNDDFTNKIKSTFRLFWKTLGTNEAYRTENGDCRERRNETNNITVTPRTQLEHLLGTAKLSAFLFNRYAIYGQNEKAKENLNKILKKFNVKNATILTLLGGFFHDLYEDMEGNEEAITIIIKALGDYDFEELEKYIIPLVKILTHRKWNHQLLDNYLEKIEAPDDHIFEGYQLSEEEKEFIITLAIHTKAGDIVHNWKSEQTESAFMDKVPQYMAFVFKHYPDLMDFVDVEGRINPEIKHFIREYKEQILEACSKGHNAIATVVDKITKHIQSNLKHNIRLTVSS